MPVKKGQDRVGHFYMWGNNGKKYYFSMDDLNSEKLAYYYAVQQGKAIHASQTIKNIPKKRIRKIKNH